VGHHSEAFIGIDTAKLRNAVAIAEAGRRGEVRYLGEVDTSEAATRKLIAALAAKYRKLTFCYEAGPDRLRPSKIDREPGPHLSRGGAIAHSKEGRRPGKDQPARCRRVGPTAAGR
jgi:hypothetical protein